ncbi:MAG: aminotransferase class III-fold pyridoxal phosphate-dependent enzyme [Hyphomicrobiaceae bacterium]
MSDVPSLFALSCTPPDIRPETAETIASELFGIRGKAKSLAGERESNFRVTGSGRDIVLKISARTETPEAVEFQAAALHHLHAMAPDLPVPRIVPTLDGADHGRLDQMIVRAFDFLPGDVLEGEIPSPPLLREVGRTLGRFDHALRGFFHPGAMQRIAWDLKRAPEISQYARLIASPETRRLVEATYERFIGRALPALARLPAQVIHNDTHPGNLLTDAARTKIVGLIDFGDMVHGARIIDVAFPAAEVTIPGVDPIASAAEILAGYHSVNALGEDEIALLYDAILARHAQTLAILAYRRVHDGTAAAILAPFEANSVAGLEALVASGPDQAFAAFRDAAGIGRMIQVVLPRICPETAEERAALLARRKRLLGPDLELSYLEPLHLVRGEGVFLHGADGRRYLDCYNNVPQVGHAHPDVVEAIARQAAILNTNTRYLHPLVLEYAERLTGLMPPDSGLSVAVFVNCGSEANDIAWRMATTWTGRRGGIVMENAYHGGTEAVAALSPYDEQARSIAPHIRTLMAPDVYRGRHGADSEAYAADATRAIGELDEAGYGVAAWMVDTGFTSNGLINPPAGYVRSVAQKVRRSGGLVIADEVQFGFARSGSHFWGFGTHDLVPDLVTMGKPVGNGHPIGVVVTRPEILAKFARETNYFSTFGGNPVSAAAGLAVLDVIARERLQENARETGAHLLGQLRALMEYFEILGDVRGHGLKFGVEIVSDRKSKAPDRPATRAIANGLRARGVLVGTEGVHGNVLKIRPPLPFRPEHAAILVAALKETLGALGGGMAD